MDSTQHPFLALLAATEKANRATNHVDCLAQDQRLQTDWNHPLEHQAINLMHWTRTQLHAQDLVPLTQEALKNLDHPAAAILIIGTTRAPEDPRSTLVTAAALATAFSTLLQNNLNPGSIIVQDGVCWWQHYTVRAITSGNHDHVYFHWTREDHDAWKLLSPEAAAETLQGAIRSNQNEVSAAIALAHPSIVRKVPKRLRDKVPGIENLQELLKNPPANANALLSWPHAPKTWPFTSWGIVEEQLKQANAAFRRPTTEQLIKFGKNKYVVNPQGVWRQGKDAPDLLWVTARTLVSVEIIAQGNTFETERWAEANGLNILHELTLQGDRYVRQRWWIVHKHILAESPERFLVDLCLMTISMDGSRALEITCKIAQALPPNKPERQILVGSLLDYSTCCGWDSPTQKTEILRNYLIPLGYKPTPAELASLL